MLEPCLGKTHNRIYASLLYTQRRQPHEAASGVSLAMTPPTDGPYERCRFSLSSIRYVITVNKVQISTHS